MRKLKLIIVFASIIGLATSCDKNEEDLNVNKKQQVEIVSTIQTSSSDIKSGGEAEVPGGVLGAKAIKIFKKVDGVYTYFKSIDINRFESGSQDPDETTMLKLESGEYMINAILYKLEQNPWTDELIKIKRAYNWTFNERRLPNNLYENGVPGLMIWNSDLFIANKEFVVDDKPIRLNLSAKRGVGKIHLVSSETLPEDWEKIEFDLTTSSVLDIPSNTVSTDKRQVKWVVDRKLIKNVPDDLNYSRYSFPCENANLSVRVWKSVDGKSVKISETRVEDFNITKGKITHLRGNWFAPFVKEGVSISIDDDEFIEEDFEF